MTDRLAEPVLPRIGPSGLLADLNGLMRASMGQAYVRDLQVWLTDDVPADFVDKLRANGVSVGLDERYDDVLRDANRMPTALTLRMQLFAALIGVGLLLGVMIFLSARDRTADELSGLRLTGVPARTLRRALRTAYLIAIGAGTLVGVGCAALAWLTARAALPLADGTPWVPPPLWPQPLIPGSALLATLAVIVAGVYMVLVRGDRRPHSGRPGAGASPPAIPAERARGSAVTVAAGSLSDHITPEGSNRD